VTSDQPTQNYTGTPLPYTLIIKADTGGTTQPPPGNYNYYFGTQVAITAIPDSGYAFSHWTEDVPFGHENDNPLTITINSDKSVKAVFQKKGLCFISTAAYGTPSHPHVRILRDFRNKYLMPYKLGRYLVSSYYRHSPFAAELISKHRALKVAVRFGLIPLVAFSYAILHFGPIISGITLFFIFVLPILPILFCRRKMRRVEAKPLKP